MIAVAALQPTRKDEAFRYADLIALAPLWPVAVEAIAVAPGEHRALSIVPTGDAGTVRELAISLGEGASFDLRVLSAGTGYCRISVRAELADRASFTLGAAQLGSGAQTLEVVSEVTHFTPTTTTDLKIAGAPAKQLIGSGEEADDGDPSNADVTLFTVNGVVYVLVNHAEGDGAAKKRAELSQALAIVTLIGAAPVSSSKL